MAAPARKPARKAQLDDVVDGIVPPPASGTDGKPAAAEVEVVRPVGRPPKKWLVPFSSKIEIELRQELDAHLEETGATIVDFLDVAIRNQLKAESTD